MNPVSRGCDFLSFHSINRIKTALQCCPIIIIQQRNQAMCNTQHMFLTTRTNCCPSHNEKARMSPPPRNTHPKPIHIRNLFSPMQHIPTSPNANTSPPHVMSGFYSRPRHTPRSRAPTCYYHYPQIKLCRA